MSSFKFALVAWVAVVAIGAPAQTVPLTKLVPDKTISAATENLTRVDFVLLHGDGTTWLSQRQDFRLLGFPAVGTGRLTIGRKGQGPGEFGTLGLGPKEASFFGGTLGDTIWTYDRVLQRFSWFLPSGKLLKTLPLPAEWTGHTAAQRGKLKQPGEVLSLIAPLAVAPGGSLVGVADYAKLRAVQDEVLSSNNRASVVRASLGGKSVAVIAQLPLDSTHATVEENEGLRSMSNPVPFRTQPRVWVSQNGSRVATVISNVTGERPILELTVYATDGPLLFKRQFPLPGNALTRSEVESAMKETDFAKRSAGIKIPRPPSPALLARLETATRALVPKFRSFDARVVLTDDGYVWITQPSASDSLRDVHLLNAAGQTILRAQLPRRERPCQGSRDVLWTCRVDIDDLDVVTRYRVR